jgi:hypothetical protein
MEPLPMAPPACSLDEVGVRSQLARYRTVGEAATVLVLDRRRVSVHVGDEVPNTLIDELVAIERECCPFFELAWEPNARRLTVSVPDAEHEPALEAIGFALGLEGTASSR